jgi:hypothetical protein
MSGIHAVWNRLKTTNLPSWRQIAQMKLFYNRGDDDVVFYIKNSHFSNAKPGDYIILIRARERCPETRHISGLALRWVYLTGSTMLLLAAPAKVCPASRMARVWHARHRHSHLRSMLLANGAQAFPQKLRQEVPRSENGEHVEGTDDSRWTGMVRLEKLRHVPNHTRRGERDLRHLPR